MAALLALLAVLGALVVLGWDRSLALFGTCGSVPGWAVREGDRRAAARQGQPFVFAAQLLPPIVLLGLVVGAGLLGVLASASLFQPLLLVATPLGMLGVRQAGLALAGWRYRRRVQAQLLPAIQSLAGLMEGGRTMLVAAFAAVTPTLPEPLRSEWSWVLAHLNLPYSVTRPDGTTERYTSTHAYSLERLAAQTPVRLHAQVLDQLVAIYEHQLEARAHERLTQLAAALARQASLQRSVATLLGRVRGEAYVIAGAFAGIVAWLAWSQPARFWSAFAGSEWGLLAALWFGLWLILPVLVALVIVRIPDLPL